MPEYYFPTFPVLRTIAGDTVVVVRNPGPPVSPVMRDRACRPLVDFKDLS